MIYSVQFTSTALKDLDGIYEYICFDLQSPINAQRQFDRIEKSIKSLDTMPFRYREYEKEPWKSKGLRMMPVDNYIIFYYADKTAGVVTISRIMYGRRNIDMQL